jgi:hypothetical protein
VKPFYSHTWRLPLPVMGIVFGLCIVVGGGLIPAHEGTAAVADDQQAVSAD